MNILSMWLYYKLCWNPYEDLDALIVEFCDKVYGDASPYMQEYYDLLEVGWKNGAELIPTLLQICYATAIGYLFVMIFHKSSSLVPCIITHCLVNSLSVFSVDNALSLYIAPIFLTVIPIAYGLYIDKKIRE